MGINSTPKYQQTIPGAIMYWKLTAEIQSPPLSPFCRLFPQSAAHLVTDQVTPRTLGTNLTLTCISPLHPTTSRAAARPHHSSLADEPDYSSRFQVVGALPHTSEIE